MAEKIKHIEVVSYNPDWPKMFEAEAAQIKEALGDNCITVYHVGSTSVPGLLAKPIIDIIAVVQNIEEVDKYNSAMVDLGYKKKGEFGIPFRRYFQKGIELRTHNLHVFEQGNPEIDRHIKFRNWMCTHSQDRDAYANLKKHLAKKFPNDIMAYCLGKDEFVASIDSKTGWNGIRIVIALTPKEWDMYHRIIEEQTFTPFDIVYNRNHPALTLENHFHFVLYKGVEIVSVAHVEFLNNKKAVIRSLATDEPYKHRGFGKAMMKLLKKWIKHKGIKVIKM